GRLHAARTAGGPSAPKLPEQNYKGQGIDNVPCNGAHTLSSLVQPGTNIVPYWKRVVDAHMDDRRGRRHRKRLPVASSRGFDVAKRLRWRRAWGEKARRAQPASDPCAFLPSTPSTAAHEVTHFQPSAQ
ncbi:hypothetical protein FA95DRAFT_1563366, partial [Auriscalpium vulgare]